MDTYSKDKDKLGFLLNGTETGQLINAYNWSQTTLGSPENWPQNLHTALGIVLHSALPMLLLWGEELFYLYNDAFSLLVQNHPLPPTIGNKAPDLGLEIWDRIGPEVQKVISLGRPVFIEDGLLPFSGNYTSEDIRCTSSYSPVFAESGAVAGVMLTWIETQKKPRPSQPMLNPDHHSESFMEHSISGIIILVGEEHRVEAVNDAYGKLIGKQKQELLGKPLFDVIPEAAPDFKDIIEQVRLSKLPYKLNDQPYYVLVDGQRKQGYLNLVYQPYQKKGSLKAGVMIECQDVSSQVLLRIQAEEKAQQVRSLVESAPFPIAVYTGKQMRIELANQAILDIWGKGNDVIGKLYSQVLPELDNQAIFSQLDRVFQTGNAFHARNQRVDLMFDRQLRTFYFNYSFTPLYDASGQVYGVMNTGADVTDLMLATQKIEQAETFLREAVDLASLGTYEIDLATGILTYCSRLKEWFGIGEQEVITFDRVYAAISKQDLPAVIAAVNESINPLGNGLYEKEYTMDAQKTGRARILHAKGKTIFDDHAQAVKMIGAAQDVTVHRSNEAALEQLVAQRTQELQDVNEELAASNQELMAINEENLNINNALKQVNQLLEQSNENLQQFAYVASHDLQEPLRKIQFFGDLLMQHDEQQQPQKGKVYIGKMQDAARRMSVLVQDLLAYSMVSLRQEAAVRVPLSQVVEAAMTTLELSISQTNAQIQIGVLPVIQGDALQLEQLFQNLLGNALKFKKAEAVPVIRIHTRIVADKELKGHIVPVRRAKSYHQIDISDNGIGFNSEHAEKIFQVFQRLHSQSKYAGTGIGLAICQKVAANHGGVIHAVGRPEEGATFSVYFPV
jgi:PAS domain S-box-containing protein